MALEHAVPPGREPGRDHPERHRDPEQEERQREPLTEVAVEVRRAADVETDQSSHRLSSSEPESERLVGVDAVDPQHRKRVRGDDGEREREPLDRRAAVRHVARPVEIVPACEQQREDHNRRKCAVVDSTQNMQSGRERSHTDRQLPGSMAPPNETTRRNKKRDGGHDTERVGERPDGVGREAANEAHVLTGQYGMKQVEERSDGDEPADDGRRTLVPAPHGERGRPEPDDHRREVHGR